MANSTACFDDRPIIIPDIIIALFRAFNWKQKSRRTAVRQEGLLNIPILLSANIEGDSVAILNK